MVCPFNNSGKLYHSSAKPSYASLVLRMVFLSLFKNWYCDTFCQFYGMQDVDIILLNNFVKFSAQFLPPYLMRSLKMYFPLLFEVFKILHL